MLAENAEIWARALSHRFARDMADDTLPDDAFRRYLVYEAALVETAIDMTAYAAAKAPALADKRWLIEVLSALANGQIGYFDEAFAALGIAPRRYDVAIPPVRACLSAMETTGRDGSYADSLAVMFAGEWMYWHWCARASARPSRDPHLRRWVEMHVDAGFKAHADWLKAQLDMLGAGMTGPHRQRLSGLFGQTLEREIAFHDAIYLG